MLGSLVAGGLSLLGGIMSNDRTDDRQAAAQAFNAAEAQKTRDFQERMSSSAYQRGMADMRAAGLNPILAYQKGPASSPSGATASTTYSPATDVLSPAVNSAMAARRLSSELDNMQATNENLRSQNKLIGAQTLQAGSQIANINADTRLKTAALQELLKKSEVADIDKKFYQSTFGTIMRNIGLTGAELLSPISGVSKVTPRIMISPADR